MQKYKNLWDCGVRGAENHARPLGERRRAHKLARRPARSDKIRRRSRRTARHSLRQPAAEGRTRCAGMLPESSWFKHRLNFLPVPRSAAVAPSRGLTATYSSFDCCFLFSFLVISILILLCCCDCTWVMDECTGGTLCTDVHAPCTCVHVFSGASDVETYIRKGGTVCENVSRRVKSIRARGVSRGRKNRMRRPAEKGRYSDANVGLFRRKVRHFQK